MPIYWELKDFLDRHDVTVTRLARDSKMSPTALYAIVKREKPVDKLHSEAIDKILTTLSGYTGEVVRHEHILRFVPPGPK